MTKQLITTFLLLLSIQSNLIGQEYELIFDLTLDGSTLAHDTPYGQLGMNDHLVMQTLDYGIIITDGTTTGTKIVSSAIDPDHIHSMGVGHSLVYIFTQDYYEGHQLWVYDVMSDDLTFVKDLGDEVIDHIYMAGDHALLYSWLSGEMANIWQSDGTADGTSLLGQVTGEGSDFLYSSNADVTVFYHRFDGQPMVVSDNQLMTLAQFTEDFDLSIESLDSGYILDDWLIMRSPDQVGTLLNLVSGDSIEFESYTDVNHAVIIGDKFCYTGDGGSGVIDLTLGEPISLASNDQFDFEGGRYNTGLAYQGSYYYISYTHLGHKLVRYNAEFNSRSEVHRIGDKVPFESPQVIGFEDNVYFFAIDDLDTQFRLGKAAACPEIKATVIDTVADIFARYKSKPILCTIDDKMLVSKYEEDTGYELYRYYPAPNVDGDCYDETFDCDDSDPSINPSAFDIPDNGIDEDCDGHDDANDFTAFIHPNPLSDRATIDLFDAESADLMIYSLDGRLTTQMQLSEHTTVLSLSQIPAGVYILRFVGPFGKTASQKIIKL